jgi:hypothetical protein
MPPELRDPVCSGVCGGAEDPNAHRLMFDDREDVQVCPICRTCYDKALQIRGRCPVCSADRLLPDRRTGGVAICRASRWSASR